MRYLLKKTVIVIILLGFSIQVWGGTPYFVVGYVWSSVGTAGTATTGNSFAGVTILRHQLAGEPAVQLNGPDPAYPSRIFPALGGRPAYYATDAGSQWATPYGAGWTLLAITQIAPGTHGWTGAPFAGAVKATLTSADAIKPSLRMPSIYMSEIPEAQLDWASNTKIALNIGYFGDTSGEAQSLAVFRRELGVTTFTWLANVALAPTGGKTSYTDSAVVADAMYDYAVAVNFAWPGGQGVGGVPTQNGIYSTLARAVTGPYMASSVQPTPTAVATPVSEEALQFEVPEGWLAYPNPATGPDLLVAIKTEKTTDFRIRAYNLVGEKVLDQRGQLPSRGIHQVALSIAKFASGIYFLHLDLTAQGASNVELPVQKIAILH